MTQLLAATSGRFFRERDLFVHDGSRLRRFRLSAPAQAVMFALMLLLIGWSVFATARLLSASPAKAGVSQLAAATEMRARQIEQRQALIEAALAGQSVDPEQFAAVASGQGGVADERLARVAQAQLEQAALVARALDVRYQVTAAQLKTLGLSPARVGAQDGMGGPLEAADPTFKQLFTSWKKLDNLQNGAIAVPSDKPVKLAAFTSGYGVRSDPFQGQAAMHAGIDLAGPLGTPIYATADGIVQRAGWNNGGYGNFIELDHGKGIATRYAHMSAVLAKSGQQIRRGDLIGRMGSTGRSTGSHLHYEVRIDSRAVNPIPFMKSTDYLVAMQRRAGTAPMDSVALGGPASPK